MSDFLSGKPWAQAPWELVTADISALAFRVVLCIQLHRRPNGEAPFPSQTTIAEMCGVTRVTVARAVKELKDAGILKCEKKVRPGGKFPVNCYTISIPPCIKKDTTPPSPVIHEVEEGEVDTILSEGQRAAAALPESASASGKQAVVAYYVDVCTQEGAKPPKRTVGFVARQVSELLDEGFEPGIVAKALELMVERRLHPSTLSTLMVEAAAGPAKAKSSVMRYGRGMTTAQILDKYGV